MTRPDLDHLFRYHPPTADQALLYDAIRAKGRDFAQAILDNAPACADQLTAVRSVMDAVMVANRAIALGGTWAPAPVTPAVTVDPADTAEPATTDLADPVPPPAPPGP